MKRSTRAFGDRVLRSRKRLFAGDQYDQEQQFKHVRLTSIDVFVTQENKIKILDHCVEINGKNQSEIKLGKIKKSNRYAINLGEMRMFDNQGEIDNVGHNNQLGAIYTRKRKRNAGETSSLKIETFDENNDGFDKRFEKKYFRKKKRKVRTLSELGYYGNDVLCKRPIVFGSHCGIDVFRFSCFVRLVLRYLRMANSFFWTQFISFLLLDSRTSIYTSIGFQLLQNSRATSHGFFKVFDSVHSIPFFTVNFNAIPSCFLYIHSNSLLNFAYIFYTFVTRVTIHEDKVSSVDHSADKILKAKKARSLIRRVPRVSLFNKVPQKKVQANVESSLVSKYLGRNVKGKVEGVVPVPIFRKVIGYKQQEVVPFVLPELYIRSTSDELTRTLEKSCAVYDMDSGDDEWLKSFNDEYFGDNERVSEDTFEKIIDAFERGMFNSPRDYVKVASAVDKCRELASKEVLEAVYSYWMEKRKKKRSPLIEVFQCYKRKIVKQNGTNAGRRKKGSSRGRGRPSHTEKQLDPEKAKETARRLEEAAKNNLRIAEESEKRLEEAAILKWQHVQVLMANADLAVYKATMALRIAEALETPGSGAFLGFGG